MATEARPFEILLAEDSLGDAELVREALMEHKVKCSLRVISDGERAIDFLNSIDADPKTPPLDLLLLDLHLPKRDGTEVLQRLRSTERYAQTPVIIITGLSSGSPQESATGDEAMMYFEKPSTLEEFMQLGGLVRRVLEEGRARAGDQINGGGGG